MNPIVDAFRDMLHILQAGALIIVAFTIASLAVGGIFLVLHLVVTP